MDKKALKPGKNEPPQEAQAGVGKIDQQQAYKIESVSERVKLFEITEKNRLGLRISRVLFSADAEGNGVWALATIVVLLTAIIVLLVFLFRFHS